MDWRIILAAATLINSGVVLADCPCYEPDEPYYSDHQTDTWPGKKEDSFYDSLTGG